MEGFIDREVERRELGQLLKRGTPQLALQMAGWFSPELLAALRPNARFAAVHGAGAQPFREQVRALL